MVFLVFFTFFEKDFSLKITLSIVLDKIKIKNPKKNKNKKLKTKILDKNLQNPDGWAIYCFNSVFMPTLHCTKLLFKELSEKTLQLKSTAYG